MLGGADFLLLQADNSIGLDEANQAVELDFFARLKADQEAADRASAEQETGLAQGASTGEDRFHHVAPKEDHDAAGARRAQKGRNSPLGKGAASPLRKAK